MGYHTSTEQKTMQRTTGFICPFSNWITKFLWIIHFGVACPEQWSNASPISTADIKKIPALLGGGGGKFFDISQTEEIIGFLKRVPVQGHGGLLFICRGCFILRCHRAIPGAAPWWMALFVVDAAPSICCGCAPCWRWTGSDINLPKVI